MNAISPDIELVGTLRQTLHELVQAVVTKPQAVTINQSVHGPLVAFMIKPSGDDIPRVIGAKGKHFRALEAIMSNLAKLINREVHLTVDESGPRQQGVGTKSHAFNTPKDLTTVEALLKKTVSMFLDRPNAGKVIRTDMGTTTIFEIQVDETNFGNLMGPTTQFDYGQDGIIIGSIKNLFDGIGKNHGRLIRVVLSKV
jgi:predicted RNA-binding protein YlqC (UPF0109 family)